MPSIADPDYEDSVGSLCPGRIRCQEARMAPHKENKMKQCHVSKKVKKLNTGTLFWIWEVIVV
jgi:hypothetical protein